MSSFMYLYSKFTEEVLLLSAATLFTLLAMYCYQWVIKKRRLGAARNQIPASVVKVYLNQLIDEAQFVRTQLFGLMNGGTAGDQSAAPTAPRTKEAGAESGPSILNLGSAVPSELEERLKALQAQLSEKESIVVNINVEKTKLLEEIESLRQNQKSLQAAGGGAGSDDLARKVKELEARLEEYSLFEDDLANLKRLQQENQQLKKKLEELGSNFSAAPTPAPNPAPTPAAAPAPEPAPAPTLTVVPDPVPDSVPASVPDSAPEAEAKPAETPLDQAAIDALLAGKPATPPETAAPPAAQDPAPAPAPAVATPPATGKDEFENLVGSVQTSLETAPAAEAKAPEATPAPAPAPEAVTPAAENKTEALAAKTDEELLKEFENLLNS